MEIRYVIGKGRRIKTDCPFDLSESKMKVGSIACWQCPYHGGKDRKRQIVYCNHPTDTGGEFIASIVYGREETVDKERGG